MNPLTAYTNHVKMQVRVAIPAADSSSFCAAIADFSALMTLSPSKNFDIHSESGGCTSRPRSFEGAHPSDDTGSVGDGVGDGVGGDVGLGHGTDL